MSTHNEPTAEDVEVARAAYHAVFPGVNKAGREGMRAALLADRARRPSPPAVAFDEAGIGALAERFRDAIGSGPLSDIRTGTRAIVPLIAEAAFAAVERAAVTRWVVSECLAEARRSLRIPTPVEAPKVTLSTGIPSTSLRTNDGKALACCPLCESGTELPHTIRDCFASMRELGQAEAHPRVVRAAIKVDRAAVRAALDGSSADVRGTFDHACHVVDAKSTGRSMWFTPASDGPATPPVALGEAAPAPSCEEQLATSRHHLAIIARIAGGERMAILDTADVTVRGVSGMSVRLAKSEAEVAAARLALGAAESAHSSTMEQLAVVERERDEARAERDAKEGTLCAIVNSLRAYAGPVGMSDTSTDEDVAAAAFECFDVLRSAMREGGR